MFAPCGAVAVSFVLIALLGCCIVGANGRAVKIKKSYRLQAEMIDKQRSQEVGEYFFVLRILTLGSYLNRPIYFSF